MRTCLIVAGEREYAHEYQSALGILGYGHVWARSMLQARMHMARPLLATFVIDRPSRMNEDLLQLVRQVRRPRAPMIVVQGMRYDEVMRSGPEYILHWDDSLQLRELLEKIEMDEREASLSVEPELKAAAE